MLKSYQIIACLLIFLSGISVSAETIKTQQAIAGTWQAPETAFAQISARQQTRLSVPFEVRISALNVEPGTEVKAGDELARFEAPALRLQLAAWYLARQELALTRERLQLLRKNEKQHTITRRDLMLGEQAVATAQSKARLAWERLAADLDILNIKSSTTHLAKQIKTQGLQTVATRLGRLQAPFAGIVIARRTSLGEQLNAGATILELEALDQVYLDVGVNETSLPTWQKGETVWPGHSDKVHLQLINGEPLYDQASGLWLIRFKANNPGHLLREGNWIKVKHLGIPEPVVWLPTAAVVARNGKTWAILPKATVKKGLQKELQKELQKRTSFKAVEIKVAPATADGRIAVLKGIQPGATVVTKGAYELLYRDLKELIKFVD